jgi:hypothetical protein
MTMIDVVREMVIVEEAGIRAEASSPRYVSSFRSGRVHESVAAITHWRVP